MLRNDLIYFWKTHGEIIRQLFSGIHHPSSILRPIISHSLRPVHPQRLAASSTTLNNDRTSGFPGNKNIVIRIAVKIINNYIDGINKANNCISDIVK